MDMKKDSTKFKGIYSDFGKYTKTTIKLTLILYFCLIIAAIYSHIAGSFELLVLQDDILNTARSTVATGIIGAVFLEYIYKK